MRQDKRPCCSKQYAVCLLYYSSSMHSFLLEQPAEPASCNALQNLQVVVAIL